MKIENKKMSVLAVIPARGGSKRLPRKNIRLLAGKPLISYTIIAAQNSKKITDCVFTSEDPEIIKVAKSYGANVPFIRPASLAGDNVRNIDTVRHALEHMERSNNKKYDIIVLLQPTSPIRRSNDIDHAIQLLAQSDLNSLASVRGPYKKRDPILKAIRNEVLESYSKENNDEPFYLYNAAIYAVKRDYFVTNNRLISERQIPLIIDELHSIDVDTEFDLIKAEAALAYIHNKEDLIENEYVS